MDATSFDTAGPSIQYPWRPEYVLSRIQAHPKKPTGQRQPLLGQVFRKVTSIFPRLLYSSLLLEHPDPRGISSSRNAADSY